MTTKRKIGDVEKLYDLEHSFDNFAVEKKQKLEKQYTLKTAGSTIFLGKFNKPFNLTHLAEFVDIKADSVTYVENKEFSRPDNTKKINKSHINPAFNYVKLNMSLILYEVKMQIFSNGIFLIRNCVSLSDAEDATEKLLFELNNHKFQNLFY